MAYEMDQTTNDASLFYAIEMSIIRNQDCSGMKTETRGGVITGKDDIFNLDQSKIDEWNIEREILLPLVRGPDVDRYYTIPSMYILYPYEQIQVVYFLD
ncbi:MAG: hypothetical protein ACYDHX_06060 [Methanothrix sp.]